MPYPHTIKRRCWTSYVASTYDRDHNSPAQWAKEELPGGLQSKKGQVKVQVEVENEN
jgi:hypothetical protein